MRKRLTLLGLALTIGLAPMAAPALGGTGSVNKSFAVSEGQTLDDSVSTVNGAIRLGAGSTVTGACHSVNGPVRGDENVRLRSISTVNGTIDLNDGTVVERGVSSVNGRIALAGTDIREDVSTVNGDIDLNGSRVDGDIETYNGGILLDGGTVVAGDIRYPRPKGSNNGRIRTVRVEIRDGSVVEGDVIVDNDRIEVEVVLSGGGEVRGEVRGARLIR